MRSALARAALLAACLAFPAANAAAEMADTAACVGAATWVQPATGEAIPAPALFERSAAAPVVLLGERHEDPEHHRWQLHVLAGLHALRGQDMAVGVEMLPRRLQPVLDRWIAGQIDEAEFLRQTDWHAVWGYAPDLYLPIFRFARMHRIPVVALNVERALVRRTGREGWAAIPPDQREGVGDPEPAASDYRERLAQVFSEHGQTPTTDASPAFRRFLEAQLVWDRAMAEALAEAHWRTGALVVGILGRGHVENGHGVPHQLRALGIEGTVSLLPWETGAGCEKPEPGVADAVYGLPPAADPPPDRPRLGVVLETAQEGIRIRDVVPDSIAAAAGIAVDDVILSAAGTPLRSAADLIAIVDRQAPGTWLPLTVRRGERDVQLVAKFPPS